MLKDYRELSSAHFGFFFFFLHFECNFSRSLHDVLYFQAYTTDLVAGRTVATFYTSVMLYILVFFKFSTTDNKNMADAKSCDTGATLTPHVL